MWSVYGGTEGGNVSWRTWLAFQCGASPRSALGTLRHVLIRTCYAFTGPDEGIAQRYVPSDKFVVGRLAAFRERESKNRDRRYMDDAPDVVSQPMGPELTGPVDWGSAEGNSEESWPSWALRGFGSRPGSARGQALLQRRNRGRQMYVFLLRPMRVGTSKAEYSRRESARKEEDLACGWIDAWYNDDDDDDGDDDDNLYDRLVGQRV
nr:hypothetical protein CFP56_50483 [Quercus suber]